MRVDQKSPILPDVKIIEIPNSVEIYNQGSSAHSHAIRGICTEKAQM
jgi:hypothetical protein